MRASSHLLLMEIAGRKLTRVGGREEGKKGRVPAGDLPKQREKGKGKGEKGKQRSCRSFTTHHSPLTPFEQQKTPAPMQEVGVGAGEGGRVLRVEPWATVE